VSTIILFVCGCILCLIFLGALYADHVHVGFLFEGRWLGPLFGVLARFWMSVAESFVLAFSLGFSQLTWVMAAISGGLGLLLILFMLGGGIAADASLWHKDQQAPLFSGGVLDRIPSLAVAAEPQLTTVARLERDDSDLFSTSGGRYLVFDVPDAVPALPRPRARLPLEGVIRDVPDVGFGPGALQPRLLMEFRRRGTQLSDSERYGEQRTPGMLLDDLPESSVIERALRLLSFDGWRASLYGGSEPSGWCLWRSLPRRSCGIWNEGCGSTPAARLPRATLKSTSGHRSFRRTVWSAWSWNCEMLVGRRLTG